MKQIQNFEHYHVDEYGNVYSEKTGKLKQLSPILTHYGYYEVQLSSSLNKLRAKIHRLVAECFISNPNNLPQVNHLDGNKLNNHVSNLEWCTPKDNLKHARENGLNTSNNLSPNGRGEKNTRSKLTEKQVLEIKVLLEHGILMDKQIAKIYNVGAPRISKIKNGMNWKHLILPTES
jgi:hypothetical protein